jgi:O-acetylserine/cysteine efflux transporter
MLVPVVGLSASAVLLGEKIGTATAVGAALVIAGVLWGARRKPPTATTAPLAGTPHQVAGSFP